MKSIIIFIAAILPFSSHANVSNGICTKIYEPILCIFDVFWNLCFAELAGFDSANCTLCTTIEPVFCTSTRTSKDRRYFSNICLAIEAGFDSGNCGPFQCWSCWTRFQCWPPSCQMKHMCYNSWACCMYLMSNCWHEWNNARLNWRRPIWMRTRNENTEMRSVTLKWEVSVSYTHLTLPTTAYV